MKKTSARFISYTIEEDLLCHVGNLNPHFCQLFAEFFMRRRWLEAECVIMKDPFCAVHYARDVIKGRWTEAEPYIMEDMWSIYNYANDIIGGRWPEAEEKIKQDPEVAMYYARDIMKERWLEIEPIILTETSGLSEYYLWYFPDASPPSKDVPLVLGNYAIMDVPNTITDKQVVDLFNIMRPDAYCKFSTNHFDSKRTRFEDTIRSGLKNGKFDEITTKQLFNHPEHLFWDIVGYTKIYTDFI